jgi:hypothetical protein
MTASTPHPAGLRAHMTRAHVALACAAALAAPGCASSNAGTLPDGGGGHMDGPADAALPPPPGFIDAAPGFTCHDPVDGPADHLLIDDSVHVGGVWNETMDFHMADYPIGWAIASVHASMLLRSRCINLDPNAVLSMALKESRLTCAVPGAASNGDGCFQIEPTTAYLELQRMFPTRFVATHAEIVANDHFETSAITMVHYMLFSTAMFRKYSSCPELFCIDHPDPHTAQKVLLGAYNRGLWWNSLANIFTNCTNHDVVDCFEPGVATDYVHAIVDYTVGLDHAAVFDAALRWEDVLAYWQRLRPLYPDADDATVTATLHAGFDAIRGSAETISFKDQIRCLLRVLIDALPPTAMVEDAVTAACGQSYLTGTACQPGGGCPADLRCRDDGPVIE